MEACTQICLMLCSRSETLFIYRRKYTDLFFLSFFLPFFLFFCFVSCVYAYRVTGRSHPVSGGPPAPAPTAPWGAMDVTPHPVPPRITAEQVSASYTWYNPSLYFLNFWKLTVSTNLVRSHTFSFLLHIFFSVNDRDPCGRGKCFLTVFRRKHLLQTSQMIHH